MASPKGSAGLPSISGKLVEQFILRLNERKDDPKFFQACKTFWQKGTDERIVGAFWQEWGVPPVLPWLLNDTAFKEAIEESLVRNGRAVSITIYPWTTKKGVVSEFGRIRKITKKKYRKMNWGEWRRRLVYYYFMGHHFLPDLFRTTPSNFARAIENKFKSTKGRYGRKPTEKELDSADALLKEHVERGFSYSKADSLAWRSVKKRRYNEPTLAAYYRMSTKRAFKMLRELLSE